MKIEDRRYQERAIEAGRESFRKGKRAPLFVGPTGCGKTTIFMMMARARVERRGRVGIFAHRDELIEQAAERARRFGLDVGCFGSNARAPVQVVSAQTCIARDSVPACDLAIFDEAHHYVASEWHRIPSIYAEQRVPIVGFSATPERADGIGLGEVFDDLIVLPQIAELVELGFLVPCEVIYPHAKPNALALDPWEAIDQHAPKGMSIVVFAPHIKAAHQFADDLVERGHTVGVVHSPVKECERGCAERRADTLDRFARGAIRIVVNVDVLTEGWDCPRAKCAVLARKYGSAAKYLQAVGRILRPERDDAGAIVGFPRALLIDLAGNVEAHGPPDEERIYSLTGTAVSRRIDFVYDVRFCRTCKVLMSAEMTKCPACKREVPPQTIPRSEHIELVRWSKQEKARRERAEAPACPHTKALGTMYAKALRLGHKRSSAEHKYRLHHREPTTQMRAEAWDWAQRVVVREKHDAWAPDES